MRNTYKCLRASRDMEEFTLKNYQKGFEVEQATVGYQVAQTWQFAHQTPVERLKEIYSRPNFDSETRHYCFKGNEMIGFLTSKVIEPKEDGRKRASLVFPSILPGHEEVTELLVGRALDTLKDKGVQVVETYVSAISGNNYELTQEWGYKHIKDQDNLVYILNGVDLKEIDEEADIRDFDQDKDLEKWLSLVREYDEISEETEKQILKELKNETGNVIAHLVIEKDGEIVGTTLIYRNDIKPSSANLPFTYVTETKYLHKLAARVKEIGKKEQIDLFFVWLYKGRLKLKKHFDALNFKYGQPSAALFEKELT